VFRPRRGRHRRGHPDDASIGRLRSLQTAPWGQQAHPAVADRSVQENGAGRAGLDVSPAPSSVERREALRLTVPRRRRDRPKIAKDDDKQLSSPGRPRAGAVRSGSRRYADDEDADRLLHENHHHSDSTAGVVDAH
jgi:hypothetical protein